MRVSSVLLCVAISAILSMSYAQQDGMCRGVALQGGGDRGSYEAGVLWGFVKNAQNPVDFQYDVLSGVSAGSINAVGMMIYPIGQEDNMVEFLNSSWRVCTQRDVFSNWPGGYLQGLFLEPSLVDNDPELTYLQSQIYAPPNQRGAVLVTTDVNTASKVSFTESDWNSDEDFAAHVALFSSAIPFLFKYRVYESFTFIDGGWSEGVDIEDVVLQCRNKVANDNQIIVDVIYCANSTIADVDASKYNGYQMYTRGNDISQWRKATFGYTFTKQSYPDVNWRYFIIPSQKLPNQAIPLDFKAENLDFMINLGSQDALTAMSEGAGVSAERVYQDAVKYTNDVFYNRQAPAIHS